MFYGMTKFSFDPSKNVFGPFDSFEEAWDYINKMADEEYDRDVSENSLETKIEKDEDAGEITITNFHSWGNDVMELFVFDMENCRK
jgi:hypothetical protein